MIAPFEPLGAAKPFHVGSAGSNIVGVASMSSTE